MLLHILFLHIDPLGDHRWDTVDESATSFQSRHCIELGRFNTPCWEQVDEHIDVVVSQDRDHIFCFLGRLIDKACEMFWIAIKGWATKNTGVVINMQTV